MLTRVDRGLGLGVGRSLPAPVDSRKLRMPGRGAKLRLRFDCHGQTYNIGYHMQTFMKTDSNLHWDFYFASSFHQSSLTVSSSHQEYMITW